MAKRRASNGNEEAARRLFWAESDYAQSILCSAMGDGEGCAATLRSSLETLPTYAPAILSLGAVEYQLDHPDEGRRLLLSLLYQPDDTEDLAEIVDKAGDFLISIGAYADGLELYRAAAARLPAVSAFHQGLSCCAGHEGSHEEALLAARAALRARARQAGAGERPRLQPVPRWQARGSDDRAGASHGDGPADRLAAENLRVCAQALDARAA